jgi:signal transduction histidine kinase
VLIEVVDDGLGLPPGDPRRLLRQGVTGPESAGTGLGLHVSAELVRRSHGSMRLEPPARGRGCTVVIELPPAAVEVVDRERLTL